MDDYISRQVILKHLEKCKGQPPEMCYTFAVLTAIESFVKSQPAADVAPVVRCNECKYADRESRAISVATRLKLDNFSELLWCNNWDSMVKKDDFCSHGAKWIWRNQNDRIRISGKGNENSKQTYPLRTYPQWCYGDER